MDGLDELISLPYRFLGAFLIFSSLAFWDWKKNPQNPTKYKEYSFLIFTAFVAILFAEIHDAITVRISPEYFIQGKGLGEENLYWKVAELAVQASYWVGLLLGLGYLIANNPVRNYARLTYRQLSKLIGLPIVTALLCAPVFGLFYWLTEKEHLPSFAFVWGVHTGSYFGAALGAALGILLILRKRKIGFELVQSKSNSRWFAVLAGAFFALCFAYEVFYAYLPDVWFFDLVSHFRWARWCGIAVLLAIFFLRHSKKIAQAWIAFLILAISAGVLLDLQESKTVDGKVELQVISFNVLTSNTEKEKTLEWLEKSLSSSAPNLVFLMEVNKEWMAALAPLKKRLPYSLEVAQEDNFGFVVYSDVPFEKAKEVTFDNSGIGAADGTISVRGRKIRFIGVHTFPPASPTGFQYRNAFLTNLKASLSKNPEPTLVFGDLNATPWSKPILRLLAENAELPQMSLSGADRKFFRSPTWYGLGALFSIPIDYILHTKHLKRISFLSGPDLGSDHRPIMATFSFSGSSKDLYVTP